MFDNFYDFQGEVQRNDQARYCRVHNNVRLCVYYIGRCVYILLLLNKNCKAYLLHNSIEREKLLLFQQQQLHDGMTMVERRIDDISKYKVQKSIMLYYQTE